MSCYLFLEAHLQVLGEETFRDKLISWLILASNESYCCVCFDLKTVSPPDCNTSDNNSQSLPSNRSIRIVFSMYFFAVSFIIMYSLLKFSLCFFFFNSRAWIHNHRSHYHSYYNPTSTNTYNHTQTNYFPTEMHWQH